jgi:hypothetical protein
MQSPSWLLRRGAAMIIAVVQALGCGFENPLSRLFARYTGKARRVPCAVEWGGRRMTSEMTARGIRCAMILAPPFDRQG